MVIKRFLSARGVFLVFMAALINVVLFAIIGGVSMVGFLLSNKSHLQSVSNLVALAALQGFSEFQGDYKDKAANALARANLIAKKNALKGGKRALSGLDLIYEGGHSNGGPGGSVNFGKWYQDKPSEGDPCDAKYPCFVSNTEDPFNESSGTANAVQVRLCNIPTTNPIIAPFASSELFSCATATATFIQRCVGFLMDTSLSTAMDSHYSTILPNSVVDLGEQSGGAKNKILRLRYPLLKTNWSELPLGFQQVQANDPYDPVSNPVITALPSYPVEVLGINCNDPEQFKPVNNFGVNTYFREKLFWCSMEPSRDRNQPINPQVHYQSDYAVRTVPGKGDILVDVLSEGTSGYFGPEPMADSYLGMNAALRTMLQSSTGGDQALFLAFSKNIVYRWPANGVSTDLAYLIKLTNLDNRGTITKAGAVLTPESHPNLIDQGLFPSSDQSLARSNIPLAMDAAISVMQRACEPTSTKIIFLFSDGFSSCARDFGSGLATYQPDTSKITELQGSSELYNYTCGDLSAKPQASTSDYRHFGASLDQIQGPGQFTDFQGRDAILTRLQKTGIKFYPVIAGKMAAPSEENTMFETKPGSNQFRRMTQDDAALMGWGSVNSAWNSPKQFFSGFIYFPGWYHVPDVPGDTDDYWRDDPGSWACANVGKPGFYCAGGSKALGKVALDSGGRHCGLRPKCKAWQDATDPLETTACGCNTYDNGWVPTDCYQSDPQNPSGPKILNPSFWDQDGVLATAQAREVNPYAKAINSPYCGFPTYDHSQTCSYYDLSKAEQAVKCASDAVGGMPYILVDGGVAKNTGPLPTPTAEPPPPPPPGPSGDGPLGPPGDSPPPELGLPGAEESPVPQPPDLG